MTTAKMKKTATAELEAPRFENGKALRIAGLRSRYTAETMNSGKYDREAVNGKHDREAVNGRYDREAVNIPGQWQRFAPHMDKIPGQVNRIAYGLCWTGRAGIDYLSGVEVSNSSSLPSEFSVVSIPAQRYAVFAHREHVSKLRDTCEAIEKWLPGSGFELAPSGAETPDFFERYTEEFNPRTGMGGMEVWIPVKS